MPRQHRLDLVCRLVDAYSTVGDTAGACDVFHEAVVAGWVPAYGGVAGASGGGGGGDSDSDGTSDGDGEAKGVEGTPTATTKAQSAAAVKRGDEARWRLMSHVVRCLVMNG